MNEYIFYTTEGYTTAPDESYEVENCQVMGIASGTSIENALNNLLEENSWIIPAGFNPKLFIVRQLVTEQLHTDKGLNEA